MIVVARSNRSVLGSWWWTVDRVLMLGFAILAVIGLILVFAASGPVAIRNNNPATYFVERQAIFLAASIALMLCASMLSPRGVLRLAWFLLAVFIGLTALTPYGPEVKGAHRWLDFGSFRLQPSEFVKPTLAVAVAWLLARSQGLRGLWPSLLPVCLALVMLARQPDIGMAFVVAAVFGIQLFLAGLGWGWITAAAGAGIGGLWGAYLFYPHFTQRVDGFMDPSQEVYQVDKAMNAVASGGLLGRGPGEGVVKFQLPDAHSDFIFAATAEEFGVITCLALVGLFFFLLFRALRRVSGLHDRFCLLAAGGLAAQFGLQAFINMAVNLNLMPTKGMTLPFISYGGSSLLAFGLSMGLLLALTRRGARLELVR
ncbi:FtsW/RodA/SpoVE family cell cycle protein [Geminicoccus flavidas]|uniref:FtsW/RodA/SpoVE family cell cycle protein n=1 Tax=Geminicoccus flavidas TaxID=2506407 RepID=UPI0013579A0B|nr:putative peptidoglycan glycosyltransferase FtsW [Geminicoccus flavidas]